MVAVGQPCLLVHTQFFAKAYRYGYNTFVTNRQTDRRQTDGHSLVLKVSTVGQKIRKSNSYWNYRRTR